MIYRIFLVLLVFPLAAAAESEVTQSAEIRVRGVFEQNPKLNKETKPSSDNVWKNRLLWGAVFRSSEKFSGKIKAIYYSTWGLDGSSSQHLTSTASATSLVERGAEDGLYILNAYGDWMVSEDFLVRAGRIPIHLGNGMVMGENSYQDIPYAFDGLQLVFESDFATLEIYGVKLADYELDSNSFSASSDPERNLYIVNVGFKSLPEFIRLANIHIIKDAQNEVDNVGSLDLNYERRDVNRYGISVGGKLSMFDYGLTFAQLQGETEEAAVVVKNEASLLDIQLGASFDTFSSRIYFGYHSDSGDKDGTTDKVDKVYEGFFYEKHENAGLMDFIAWGNLTHLKAGYSFEFTEDSAMDISYHSFAKTKKEGAYTILSGTTTSTSEADLGKEIDLSGKFKFDGGFQITSTLGFFTPGESIKQANATLQDSFFQVQLEGVWKF